MEGINWLGVVLGAVAFFAVGAVWYTVLFGKAWQRATGLSDAQLKDGANMPLIFGTCLLLELVVALTVGHMFDYLEPDDRSKMMLAVGLAAGIMAPALGISYLYLRKPLKLWLIDAGHFIAGMAALGGVFALLD
ncbi:MAG TPA: DUF1761 domain-containing protein [Croceibacterium sp.]|nr:DUF1761 domain-containing protein [Croceibacterium sp.]